MTMRRAIVYAVLLAAAVALWLFTHSEKAQIKRVFADAAAPPNKVKPAAKTNFFAMFIYTSTFAC